MADFPAAGQLQKAELTIFGGGRKVQQLSAATLPAGRMAAGFQKVAIFSG
jgi:hypothetical protein